MKTKLRERKIVNYEIIHIMCMVVCSRGYVLPFGAPDADSRHYSRLHGHTHATKNDIRPRQQRSNDKSLSNECTVLLQLEQEKN